MSGYLFILGCVLLFVLFCVGFAPGDFAVIYLSVFINAVITLLVLGALCFG